MELLKHNVNYDIGERVGVYMHDRTARKCECCGSYVESVKKTLKTGEIIDIRISIVGVSYGVHIDSITYNIEQEKLIGVEDENQETR